MFFSQVFQNIISKVIDDIYYYYEDQGKQIKTIEIGTNGNATVKFWSGSSRPETYGDVNSALEGTNYEFSSHGNEKTYLYFNEDGQLVTPWQKNNITDNKWPKIVLRDKTNNKTFYLAGNGSEAAEELGQGVIVDANNEDSYFQRFDYKS